MAKISVIVAVYNAEKYLRQCLNSIMNQSYKDIEIICVNDGSTDSSLEILNEYAGNDCRFKIYTKENEGLGGASARNYGLDKAVGEYISILDSDDFFEDTMLEKALLKAEKLRTDIVVFGGCEYDDVTGNVAQVISILNRAVVPQKEVFSRKDCKEYLFQLTQGMAWNKLYKKEFIDNNHLRFQKIKYTDDAYFTFLSMALAQRIAVVDQNLCYYRVNTGVSQTDGLANYPDSAYIPYIELKKTFMEHGIYDEISQSFNNCAATFMRYFYDKINSYKSFEYLHNKYRDVVFKSLDIADKDKDYFYDKRVYSWVRSVIENDAGEIAFKAARFSGDGNTTSSIRFTFPYDKVDRGSRVMLIGAGLIGRHYCSQIILSGYCDIVGWLESNNVGNFTYIEDYSALESRNFDYVIIAYANPKLITNTLSFLENLGIDRKKIIVENTEERK